MAKRLKHPKSPTFTIPNHNEDKTTPVPVGNRVRLEFGLGYIEVTAGHECVEIKTGGTGAGFEELVVRPDCSNKIKVMTNARLDDRVFKKAKELHEVWVRNEKDDAFKTKSKGGK